MSELVNRHRTIWKFPLQLALRQVLRVPRSARILSCQYQGGVLTLWAFVDPDAAQEDLVVHIVGTGRDMPTNTPLQYLGTVQTEAYVWHVMAEARR